MDPIIEGALSDGEGNYHRIYYHPRNMLATASNLIHFALGQIIRTTHLKDLEELKSLIVENGRTTEQMSQEKITKLKKFIFDGLIDSIRISICFENLIKAILLCNEYLVHVIDRNKDKKLHLIQKERPIKVSEYLVQYSIEKDKKSGIDIFPHLLNKTLSFSEITGPAYQEVVKIPKEILNIVSPLYKKRNQIHFYHIESFEYGSEIIKDFEKLSSYSVGVLINLNNKIIEKLEGPGHRYIDPDKFKLS